MPWVELSDNAALFNAVHEQLASIKTLNNFLDAKAQGATFGAMSEAEWDMLKASATKLDRRLDKKEYNAELIVIRAIMQGKSKAQALQEKRAFLENYGKEEPTNTPSNGYGVGNSAPTPEEQAFIDSLY